MSQVITAPGFYPDFPEEVYHADPVITPSLSSGAANAILNESPMHCHHSHPRLGGEKRVPTDEMIFGSIVHKLLLGKGSDIEVWDSDSWRGAEAGLFWDRALFHNHLPCLPKTMERAELLMTSVKKQLVWFGLDNVFEPSADAQSEVAGFWKEEDSWCRLLIDRRIIDPMEDRCHMYDIKTMGLSSHPRACKQRIASMGYDLQESHYKRGGSVISPQYEGRTDFTFLFIETKPPFCLTPFPLDNEWIGIGEKKRKRALAKWNDCMATNKWPGYVETIEPVGPPNWLSFQEDEEININ